MNPLVKLIETSIRESGMRVHSHGRASLLSEDKTSDLAERIARDLLLRLDTLLKEAES